MTLAMTIEEQFKFAQFEKYKPRHTCHAKKESLSLILLVEQQQLEKRFDEADDQNICYESKNEQNYAGMSSQDSFTLVDAAVDIFVIQMCSHISFCGELRTMQLVNFKEYSFGQTIKHYVDNCEGQTDSNSCLNVFDSNENDW